MAQIGGDPDLSSKEGVTAKVDAELNALPQLVRNTDSQVQQLSNPQLGRLGEAHGN